MRVNGKTSGLRTAYFLHGSELAETYTRRVGPPLSGFRDYAYPEVTERVECVEGVCRPSRHFISVWAVLTELQWFFFGCDWKAR